MQSNNWLKFTEILVTFSINPFSKDQLYPFVQLITTPAAAWTEAMKKYCFVIFNAKEREG